MGWSWNNPLPNITTDRFLSAFCESQEEKIYFRDFIDGENRSGRSVACNTSCTLSGIAPHLQLLHTKNETGRGVFFVVNGGGQKDETINRIRAQFIDIDHGTPENQETAVKKFPLEPSFVVKTKRGLHCYWLLNGGERNLFTPIQEALASHFGSDPAVKNLSRVMRLPGFNHMKDPKNPFLVALLKFDPELKYSQQQILSAIEADPAKDIPQQSTKGCIRWTAGYYENGVVDPEKIYIGFDRVYDVMREGNRSDTLARLAGSLAERGTDHDSSVDILWQINAQCPGGGLPEKEFESTILKSFDQWSNKHEAALIGRVSDPAFYEKFKKSSPGKFLLDKGINPIGAARLFAQLIKDRVRYCDENKQYYVYSGGRWQKGYTSFVSSKAMDFATILPEALNDEMRSDKRFTVEKQNMLLRLCSQLAGTTARKNLMQDAAAELSIRYDEFDKRKDVLNVKNGTLLLNDGGVEFVEHDPEMYLTRICSAEYDPAADQNTWISVVKDIMQSDPEKTHFLQKCLGITIAPNIREDKFFIFWGQTTRNGKSTILDTVGAALGGQAGYYKSVRPNTIAVSWNKSTKREDVAALEKYRFVTCPEPEEGMILDSSMIKALTGGDTIAARALYSEDRDFIADCKLFLNTNPLPIINDPAEFDSGRVVVVPFTRHFEEHEQDKGLRGRLKSQENKNAVLMWLIEGYKNYYTDKIQHGMGLSLPAEVKCAVDSLQADNDRIGLFLSDCFVADIKADVKADEMYSIYQRWCGRSGYMAKGKYKLLFELRHRGLLIVKKKVQYLSGYRPLSGYLTY